MTISVASYAHCVCRRRGVPHPLCDDELAFEENGKKIRLTLRSDEEGVALVLDGCVFRDDEPKCDGLFLWKKGRSKKCAILVELKGTDIERAFEQIMYVRSNRPEYQEIRNAFADDEGSVRVLEKALIVSNSMMGNRDWQKIQERYGISVWRVLDVDATKKVEDVRRFCQ